jgi:serine/threonine-protein kinase
MRYQSCAELYYALQNFEQADDEYYRRQSRKLTAFIVAAGLSAFLLIVGIISQIAYTVVVGNTVESLIQQARLASDSAQAEKFYLQAIELKPSSLPSYTGLINLYKQDNVFTVSEEEVFQRVAIRHLNSMRSGSAESAMLNYEVGILYLYYYSAADVGRTSDVVRASYAIEWFSYAASIEKFDLRDNAELFYLVCDDTIRVFGFESRMSMTPDDYVSVYDDLCEVLDLAESQNDIVRIQVAEIVLNTLYECRYSMENAGITTEQQYELFIQARNLLKNTNAPTVEYLAIKADAEQLVLTLLEFFEARGIRRR